MASTNPGNAAARSAWGVHMDAELSITKRISTYVQPQVLVSVTFGVAGAILAESGLSFLGLGDANLPSWGKMLDEGKDYFTRAWWLAVFPGFAIFFTVLMFNLVGEGLRDAMDPRLRE